MENLIYRWENSKRIQEAINSEDLTVRDGDQLELERTDGYHELVVHDPDSPNGEYTISVNTNTITILTPLATKKYLPTLNPFKLLTIWVAELWVRR